MYVSGAQVAHTENQYKITFISFLVNFMNGQLYLISKALEIIRIEREDVLTLYFYL